MGEQKEPAFLDWVRRACRARHSQRTGNKNSLLMPIMRIKMTKGQHVAFAVCEWQINKADRRVRCTSSSYKGTTRTTEVAWNVFFKECYSAMLPCLDICMWVAYPAISILFIGGKQPSCGASRHACTDRLRWAVGPALLLKPVFPLFVTIVGCSCFPLGQSCCSCLMFSLSPSLSLSLYIYTIESMSGPRFAFL